jgi:MinD-like ATPase involved in chromosome partitioning or flagellar assembly
VNDSRTCVLVVGAGAPWESAALAALTSRAGIVLLKRCMDVTDLLANAAAGQAQVALVSLDAPGLDASAVAHLVRHQVRPVAVASTDRDGALRRARQLGIPAVVDDRQLDRLADAVLAAGREQPTRPRPAAAPSAAPSAAPPAGPALGRAVAVWGPTGAPGRTTIALGIAGELARRGDDPLVLDVDPWGGAVAQHLGVLDEVSGLLACARFGGSGELAGRYLGLQRRVAGLRVVTGLPRADRWVEVRAGTVEQLVDLGRRQGQVVLDTGFCLEEDPAADYAGRAGRNAMTLAAVTQADTVVVVGSADPVGLSRLARGLTELREITDGRPVHVVVNRWRSRLGWAETDVANLVAGFATLAGLHFVPEDRDAADRALLAGRTLAELGDSPLSRAMSALVDGLFPASAEPARRTLRHHRTAGRALRR